MIKKIKLKFYFFTFERFPNLFRPSSKPYISGDTFRSMANHIFDESKSFNPKKLKKGDLVFLNPELCDIYFKIQHPLISHEYKLLTHNNHLNISNKIQSLLDEKIIHWYVLNLDISSTEKYSLLPYGIENLRYFKYGRKKWFKGINISKKNLILSSFSLYSNYQVRKKIEDIVINSDLIKSEKYVSQAEYFVELKDSLFVICPPGHGHDTSRIWEGLIVDTFPIFMLDNFTNQLREIGVPGIYLNNWEDILKFTEEDLRFIYKSLITKNFKHLISYEYWFKKIKLDM